MAQRQPLVLVDQLYEKIDEALHTYSIGLEMFDIPKLANACARSSTDWATREYNLELRSGQQLVEDRKALEGLVLKSAQQHVGLSKCFLLQTCDAPHMYLTITKDLFLHETYPQRPAVIPPHIKEMQKSCFAKTCICAPFKIT